MFQNKTFFFFFIRWGFEVPSLCYLVIPHCQALVFSHLSCTENALRYAGLKVTRNTAGAFHYCWGTPPQFLNWPEMECIIYTVHAIVSKSMIFFFLYGMLGFKLDQTQVRQTSYLLCYCSALEWSFICWWLGSVIPYKILFPSKECMPLGE